jgi:hypothetical protein
MRFDRISDLGGRVAKVPFGKKNGGLIEDVSKSIEGEESAGKGVFGNGVSEPS